ncbi:MULTISPECIES: DUF6894 family protein [Mesorhizobium]|uniref:DUF6894 family protein n=1 Tax=Mesorhizobium TaxID=68287 RepID=UPI00101009A7|nr:MULTISPECIES: hypothetical protein [Mesorhizobium]
MPLYFFDLHDGEELAVDTDGIVCASLEELSFHAVDVLPDIAREVLPDGPRRTFSVKVRNALHDQLVFRATLTLASAWIVDEVDGHKQPGGDRWQAALSRAKTQVSALRKELAEDGYSHDLEGLDSLLSVAEAEIDRHLARGAPKPPAANP